MLRILVLVLLLQSIALSAVQAETVGLYKCSTRLEGPVIGVMCVTTDEKRAFSFITYPMRAGSSFVSCAVWVDGKLQKVPCADIELYLK